MEDAKILKELLETIKMNRENSFQSIIEEKASYKYLYHLSEIRENLVDWLPVTKNMHVLERNAECGALTGKLLWMAGRVTAVTGSEIEAEIIRVRTGAPEHLEVLTETEWMAQRDGKAAEKEIADKPFDMILIAGCFYRFREELALLKKMQKCQGKLIASDANRLGLKYMAGCQEEYRGGYFTGIEGYEGGLSGEAGNGINGRCYTRKEYCSILKEAGYRKLEFYYPYPDYKFPSCIYSDRWLPRCGELADNRRNFEEDRYQLFDESRVFDTLLAEGLFPEFSNSFLIEAEA